MSQVTSTSQNDKPDRLLLSIVTPAFNEEANLAPLYERFVASLVLPGLDWEWIIVDDHSTDQTFTAARALGAKDPRVRGVRLARNHGSHLATICGLQQAKGDCVVLMDSDQQEPPELIPQLIEKWRGGAQVVWAVRASREGVAATTRGTSRVYHGFMRRVIGLRNLPATGSEFLLLDRRVVDAFLGFGEQNTSILALVAWMGFRQEQILYVKEARKHGKSGWTLAKKLKLVVDSVTSFSYLPIRMMALLGILVSLAGFAYAVQVVVNAFVGNPTQGWSSLMVALLILNGLQMCLLAVLGEYVWRSFDEARRRPRFLIEDEIPPRPRHRSL